MRLLARTLLVLPANLALAAVFFIGVMPVALGQKEGTIVALGVLQVALAAVLAGCSLVYYFRQSRRLSLAILVLSAMFALELVWGDYEHYSLASRFAWPQIVPLSPYAVAIWIVTLFVLKTDAKQPHR